MVRKPSVCWLDEYVLGAVMNILTGMFKYGWLNINSTDTNLKFRLSESK